MEEGQRRCEKHQLGAKDKDGEMRNQKRQLDEKTNKQQAGGKVTQTAECQPAAQKNPN